MDPRDVDLRAVNRATKYPSILTYHALGERGRLREEVLVPFDDEPVVATEKIDGTNARIVLFPGGGYLIGSREELLHARGDLIHNPALGIVDATRAVAERVAEVHTRPDRVLVVFGEVYGGKTTAARAYGTAVGFRIFDAVAFAVDALRERVADPPEALTRWREAGGQPFVDEAALQRLAAAIDVPVTPRLPATPPPRDVRGAFAWLSALLPGETLAPLAGDRSGRPEGIVLRTADRRKVTKLRFEDYERTLR